ncbi:hypothetical protein F7734_14995 [Scytonema sp. UIC 10036]|uniref:hypothetical protein n=1 Tax=Scytonema sp. UIC 10036 TaxID=2304196 RepID=UPI0012DAD611|nr:hypothetical protein [Scytonema sp. UIC 10036]MUG93654.1 hypothetical protein [Scytonema sp. UIC 10036]
MAKIKISQLQTVDTASIQELTNAEIHTTKGGIAGLPFDVLGVVSGASGVALDAVSGASSGVQKYLSEDLPKSLGLA